jgi:hypothetical protein
VANEIIFDPRTMLEAVRIMKPRTTFFRTFFMRNVRTSPQKTVQADFKRGGAVLAPIVNEIVGGKLTTLPGYSSNIFKTPLVAPDKVLNAADLGVRLPGESPYSTITTQDRDAALVAESLEELDGEITRREEWMCAVALITGKIEYKSDDTEFQIDFGFQNKITLAAGSLWSDANSNPINEIESWQDDYILKYGYQKGDILVGAVDAINAFWFHPKIQDLLKNYKGQFVNVAPRITAPGITYVGTIDYLGIDVYKYAETYKDDVDGQMKKYIPDGQVVLLSSAANFEMAYGAVDLADEETNTIRTVQGARVPDSWVEKRPIRRIINLSSRPLPIPREVDSWVSAKVL